MLEHLTGLGVTAIEAPGSHEGNFTRPEELADAFLTACAAKEGA